MEIEKAKVFVAFEQQFLKKNYLAFVETFDGCLGVYQENGTYYLNVWKSGGVWRITSDPMTVSELAQIQSNLSRLVISRLPQEATFGEVGLVKFKSSAFAGGAFLELYYRKLIGFTLADTMLQLALDWPSLSRFIYELELTVFLSK